MAKLFTRSSSKTLPTLARADSDTDEFGRTPSRGFIPSSGTKRDKAHKQLDKATRQRTISNPNFSNAPSADRPGTPRDVLDVQDGFLATNLDPPLPATDEWGQPKPNSGEVQQEYGYICWEKHVILGIDEVTRLVDVVAEELRLRGITTPLLFSPLALDIKANVIRKLIAAFLKTVPHHTCLSITEVAWREEAQFAGPHELAMLLRWGLARIVRVERNVELRGFLSFDHYLIWKRSEAAAGYPNNHYKQFLQPLEPGVRSLLASLFDLLARFAANAVSSGLTPIVLASLFGPLLFGLGPSASAFTQAYTSYLRASHASEHLLLSFIRWQETQAQFTGALPVRLRDWIRGYPGMITPVERMEKPRKTSRLVRLGSIRRNVRLYSPDLVRTAASWSTVRGDFQDSKDWSRICPANLKLPPRYADTYRKFMNVPPTFHPEMGAGSTAGAEGENDTDWGSIGGPLKDENRFRSLTDMKWGNFESLGFSDTDNNKLAFDLTESARKSRSEKRQTLNWTDFSQAGFSRTDAPLSATLQFSTPLASSISTWGSQQADLHRKLKKTQKSLPPFGWDTSPVLGQEQVVEEGFIEVFTQLAYGGGWMERTETTFRDGNWALVEFKSLPTQRPPVPPAGDPRTSPLLLLFEEFVPREYREQLTAPKKKRLFARPGIFSSDSSSKKQWKAAPTLNGRPYVWGSTPQPPSADRAADFESMLLSAESTTKLLSLSRGVSTREHPIPTPLVTSSQLPKEAIPPVPPLPHSLSSPVKRPKFRLTTSKRTRTMPSEYDDVDFEMRETSDSELSGASTPRNGTANGNGQLKQERRQSKDDAWIDILVGDSAKRRLPGQDAELKPRSGKLKNNRSDPELAQKEIDEALSRAGAPPPDDDFFHHQSHVLQRYADGAGEVRISEEVAPEPYPYSLHPLGRPDADGSEGGYTSGGEGPMIRVQSPTIASSVASAPYTSQYIPPDDTTSEFEAMSVGPGQEMEIHDLDVEEGSAWSQGARYAASTGPIRPLPTTPADPTTTKGKVGSLIELYQQKAGGEGEGVPPPRGVSLNGPTAKTVPPPLETVTLPTSVESNPGRVSPGRYIHGAPLHNVIEAEEEED